LPDNTAYTRRASLVELGEEPALIQNNCQGVTGTLGVSTASKNPSKMSLFFLL